MFPGVEDVRVFVKPGPTDMRKSINGLTVLVQEAMGEDPFSGGLFVFCNRRRNIIKIVYWDRNGFCLWFKKPEKSKFPWPRSEEDCLHITEEQLEWLLRGIDFWQEHTSLEYSLVI